ncbi:MAG TPA: IPT/TIG domain-containing protein [Prolixibacteraceae bacterium]|nr:IPT/TIG domain-containing protein [Prolixibacteraceae bacterium]
MQASISKNTRPGRTTYRLHLFMLLLATVLLAACTKEELATREYPRVNTLEVTNISPEGVTFNGEVFLSNHSPVEKVGFIWSTKEPLSILSDDTTIITGTGIKTSFQKQVSHSLTRNVQYYVRAFAITDKYTSYGPILSFKSTGSKAPVITDCFPSKGNYGDTVTIIGDNFSSSVENITVSVGNLNARVIKAEKTRISIVLPTTTLTGDASIRVMVASMITTSTGIFEFNSPHITAVEPQRWVIGKGDLTLTGEGFSPDISKNILTLNDIPVKIVSASKNKIIFSPPLEISPGVKSIKITVGGKTIQYTGNLDCISPWTMQKKLATNSLGPPSVFTLNDKMYI